MMFGELGEPEILDFYKALLGGDHDVCRPDIPVHDARRMRGSQSVGDLNAILQRIRQVKASAPDEAI
jgi:hypothetical protein